MDIGRQSMYDTFGDKRALFLKALEMYVTENVQSINMELERPGSALSAAQNALAVFAERNDLSSPEGCMGLNALGEFGQRDADVTRITRSAARVQRQTLMRVLARAKDHGELAQMQTSTAWRTSLRARSPESGWRPRPARAGRHFGISQRLRAERTWYQIAQSLPSDGQSGMYGPPPYCKRKMGMACWSARMYPAFVGVAVSWPDWNALRPRPT
jgi:AcrR family transcriptional regulator